MTTQETDNTRSSEQTEQPDEGKEARVHLGERLSQARQAKGISIRDTSDRLRIRIVYLEALENGDWSDLPEEVYVMGFLRQYTALLGIDLSEEIAALKTGEYQLTKPFTIPDPPIAMNRTWAIVAGVAFLLLLILFNVIDDGEKDQAPPVTSLPLTAPGGPASPASQPAAAQPESAQSAQPAASGNVAPAPQAGTSARPATVGTTASATTPASNAAPAATPTIAQAAPAVPGHVHTYVLTAVKQSVWLQLRTPDGKLVKEALLRGGQSMRVDSDADHLMLTAGNPLALSVDIDQKPVIAAGSLGEKNRVLHDYRLPPATPVDTTPATSSAH